MLRLVEVCYAESGWKGDWYKVNERHWVSQQPKWPSIYTSRWLKAELGFCVCGFFVVYCITDIGPWHPRAWQRTEKFYLEI